MILPSGEVSWIFFCEKAEGMMEIINMRIENSFIQDKLFMKLGMFFVLAKMAIDERNLKFHIDLR